MTCRFAPAVAVIALWALTAAPGALASVPRGPGALKLISTTEVAIASPRVRRRVRPRS